MKQRKKFENYEVGLIERLGDPKYAAEYLNAHLAGSEGFNQDAFLLALRDVAVAYGIGKLARRAKLGRESLYKTLSKKGNPKVSTLTELLNTLGLRLFVEEVPKKAAGI